MRKCAYVPFVESVMSITPTILNWLIPFNLNKLKMDTIVAFRYHVLSEFNKPKEWIAILERVIQFIPWWIIDNLKGIMLDYDKKLDTLERNKNSRVVLSGICQPLCNKATINISRYRSYSDITRCCKLTVEDDSITQGSKCEQTLNIDKKELREEIAELFSKAKGMDKPSTISKVMRSRSHRSNYVGIEEVKGMGKPSTSYETLLSHTEGVISNDNINNEKMRGDSGQWTSMKPSNVQPGKKPGRKPVRQSRPDLFVEVSNRLKKYVSKDKKYYNLNELLSDPYFLIACYENIKSKPGNMTQGIDKYTLDGINGDWFIKAAQKLKAGTYNFTPARLVEIPKANGKTRTLSITSPRDKIIQKAVAVILEAIYEPIFKDSSFGFRRRRSTHDALKLIKLQGAAYSWVIQGDITNCFNSIPHKIIRREINKTVACPNMKALINKIISYPYVNPNTDEVIKSKIGTPQGTICSPILANIILHLLDCYLEKYRENFNKGKLRAANPKYLKLRSLRRKARKDNDRKLATQYLVQMRRITGFDPMDSDFRRLLYVRYADDFIIMIIGSYKECCIIREDVHSFLINKCGLSLNLDKTRITSMKKHFRFLGADIVNNPTKDYIVFDKGLNTYKKAHIRSLIKAPIKDLIDKLIYIGLAKRNKLKQIYPKGRTNLFNKSHYDIVTWYNSKVRGILSYFSFASNYPKIGRIIWYLKASCALTLANKYKLRTMAKTFQKFGKSLKDPESGIQFFQPTNFRVSNQFNTFNASPDDLDKIINASWASKLTETSFNKVCSICGSSSEIEMHHVRKIGNIRSKIKQSGYSTNLIISAMNRKQVPLCRYHHMIMHKGELSYWEVRKVVNYKE